VPFDAHIFLRPEVQGALVGTLPASVQPTCAACGRSAAAAGVPRLKRCGGCAALLLFCGTRCFRDAWAAHHRAQCRRVSGADGA
jgi:hypothetical protein